MSTKSIRWIIAGAIILVALSGFHLGVRHLGDEVRSRGADSATVGLAIAGIYDTHAGVETLQVDADTLKNGQRNIFQEVAWLKREMINQRDSLMFEINRLRVELDSVKANCK